MAENTEHLPNLLEGVGFCENRAYSGWENGRGGICGSGIEMIAMFWVGDRVVLLVYLFSEVLFLSK